MDKLKHEMYLWLYDFVRRYKLTKTELDKVIEYFQNNYWNEVEYITPVLTDDCDWDTK